MIIRSVTLTDFGVYGGSHEFELAPTTDGAFDRPVVLFRGNNGVGKTTFVEGVRIALHGSLAIGNRVSRKAYEAHLRRRIHRPHRDDADRPEEAAVEVVFDHVRGGESHTYRVCRSWRSTGVGLVESLDVQEDGSAPAYVAADDYDSFLRELVPAAAGDLFFFDGEKIDQLVDDDAADDVLREAVEQLLGLHLVTLLDSDLSVYVERALDRVDRTEAEGELAEARRVRDELTKRVQELDADIASTREDLAATLASIQQQEQELATEGGAYAEHFEHLKATKKKLEVDIEATRRRIVELAAGTLPFALAPNLLRNTLNQMEEEARYRDAQAVRDLAERQRRNLERVLLDDATYERTSTRIAQDKRPALIQAVLDAIAPPEPDVVDAEDVYLHASDHDRAVFTAWRAEADGPVAEAMREAAEDFASMEKRLSMTEEALTLAPPDLLLQPIVEALTRLRAKKEKQEAALDSLLSEAGTARFKLEKAESRLERANEALEAGEGVDDRIKLALRTRRAFQDYARKLRARKVRAFADSVLTRFNELCRKERLLDAVDVDPESFAITLHRDSQAFGRSELSAGEKQLFAVSALWALREVSEASMPVVVDTPLGRLDSEHRLAMVRTFLPHVSHQVILLATDTEVDQALAAEIAPAVSHGYNMDFNSLVGATEVERFEATDVTSGSNGSQDAESRKGTGLIELDVLPSA